MVQTHGGLGQRIVYAATLAAELHRQALEQTEDGRHARLIVGGGFAYRTAAGLVKDDTRMPLPPQPSSTTSEALPSGKSSWTSAGEYPAGSFAG
jgi:hypothetical protein